MLCTLLFYIRSSVCKQNPYSRSRGGGYNWIVDSQNSDLIAHLFKTFSHPPTTSLTPAMQDNGAQRSYRVRGPFPCGIGPFPVSCIPAVPYPLFNSLETHPSFRRPPRGSRESNVPCYQSRTAIGRLYCDMWLKRARSRKALKHYDNLVSKVVFQEQQLKKHRDQQKANNTKQKKDPWFFFFQSPDSLEPGTGW